MIGSFATVLLAAEKEAPLIDLDGTGFLQLAIFLTMLLVLYRLVFKPYLAMRDQRDKGIGGAKGEARSMEERAAVAASDLDTKLIAAKQRGEQERLKLRAEAAAHERQVLGAARDAAQRAIADSREQIRTAEQAARSSLLAETPALATQVAARVLGRPLS